MYQSNEYHMREMYVNMYFRPSWEDPESFEDRGACGNSPSVKAHSRPPPGKPNEMPYEMDEAREDHPCEILQEGKARERG